jgi:PKD repeat protein
MTTARPLLTTLLGLTLAACGDGSSPTTPSTPGTAPNPTPSLTAANRAPVINSMTVTPTFGVSQLTSIAMTASGTDPDGDAVTFEWDFGDGTRGTGAAFSKVYGGSGVASIRLTASDGRGGTATDTRTVTVGTMVGAWRGIVTINAGQTAVATMNLTQAGGTVVGTMVLAGFDGRTDPAQPGRIDASGQVELRMKVDPFSDFTMRGTMDATGTRITGAVFGSGFNGQPFSFDRQ